MPLARAGEIKIYYESQGQGPALLLLMGLGFPGDMWIYQVEILSHYFQVITLDNRGVGRSDKPSISYSIEMFADDVANLLRVLGIRRAHILGMSMGGAIAQQFALRHGEMVDKLMLCCTWSHTTTYGELLMETWRTVAEKAGLEALARLSLLQSLTPRCFQEQPSLVQRLLDLLLKYPQPVEAYIRQNRACVAHNTSKLLSDIKFPTLVLAGNRDVQTPIGSSYLIARQIPGAQLQVLNGLGHGFMWEDPERFNKAVLDFLQP